MRIFLVEDDTASAEIIQLWLQEAGHDCKVFGDGKSVKRELSRDTVDAVILDWMLPGSDGIEILQWIRQRADWQIPVLFVTGKDAEADVVYALKAGADDYLTKPVKRGELLARIDAVSRRSMGQEDTSRQLKRGHYTIDTVTRSVYLDNQPIELTQKEFDLVLCIFRNAGRLLSRAHILENVWGRNPDLNTRTVDTHISRIRNKLKLKPENGWQLRAVYQHGYRLERSDELHPH